MNMGDKFPTSVKTKRGEVPGGDPCLYELNLCQARDPGSSRKWWGVVVRSGTAQTVGRNGGGAVRRHSSSSGTIENTSLQPRTAVPVPTTTGGVGVVRGVVPTLPNRRRHPAVYIKKPKPLDGVPTRDLVRHLGRNLLRRTSVSPTGRRKRHMPPVLTAGGVTGPGGAPGSTPLWVVTRSFG